MAVSSQALFHYTRSLNNLKSIMINKFQLTYCKEAYVLGGKKQIDYYPMISFCDIPLLRAKDHIRKYGSYAIGLKKEWGVQNRLNPVLYIEQHSVLSFDLLSTVLEVTRIADTTLGHTTQRRDLIEEIVEDIKKQLSALDQATPIIKETVEKTILHSLKALTPLVNQIVELNPIRSALRSLVHTVGNPFRYIKNCEGLLERADRDTKVYNFYDEREWRFVPSMTDSSIKPSLTDSEYAAYRNKGKSKPFIPGFQLPFSATDVDYVIVKNRQQVKPLQQYLRAHFQGDPEDLDLLCSAVQSFDKIHSNF